MTDDATPESSDGQSIDAICELLSDARRRYVVSALSDQETAVALTDLATDVAAWEAESDRDAVSPETVESVAVSLHHLHLPKLDEAGVVAYDRDAKMVSPRRVEPLEDHVEAVGY